LAYVENFSHCGLASKVSGYESSHQLSLPYAGLCTYRVGSREWRADTNSTLMISRGWEFELPPSRIGQASLLVNPSCELVDELCSPPGSSARGAFSAVALRTTAQLRLVTQWMLTNGEAIQDPLQNDEWVMLVLQQALQARPSGRRRSSTLVNRAKEVLHEGGFDRLTLTDVARQVGVSPAYLTQEFKLSEGIPLYRYQLAVRLGRALLELPHCADITALALDLGFSSHSHFSLVFRKVFGTTPSKFRDGSAVSKSLETAPTFRQIRERLAFKRAA
jgi:AraC-like DNA-binding protein